MGMGFSGIEWLIVWLANACQCLIFLGDNRGSFMGSSLHGFPWKIDSTNPKVSKFRRIFD